MKVVVAVIAYDRFYNVVEWVRCWNLCAKQDAQLVIVHNYANDGDRESYQAFCAEAGVSYIPRHNIGFDIGAFQDVARNRLEGFPEFDYLIWCTDDVLPMRKDFVYQYLQQKADVAAMHLSPSVRLHIRTTGFGITREALNKMQFPADPKQQRLNAIILNTVAVGKHFWSKSKR